MAQTPVPQNTPQATSLMHLRKQESMPAPAEMRAGFDTVGGFELMQRGARLLSSSTIVPASYRSHTEKKIPGGVQIVENPAAMSNCVVALNMAQRMGADPLMIMQNLYIVEGRPAWSSQYIIASINACGKYSPLRFTIEELGEKEVEYVQCKWVGTQGNRSRVENIIKTTIHDRRCIAWATEKATGERLESPPVTVELAVKEGWYGKDGSKWQTMPEVMLRYRAASFFGKLYAPELLMGIQTAEEVRDATYTVEPDETGTYQIAVADIRRPEESPVPGENAGKQEPQNPAEKPEKKAPPKAPEKKTSPKAPSPEANTPPAVQNVPSEPDEPDEPYEDPQSYAMTVICAKTEKPVDEIDCASCPSRKDCPSWE